MAAPAETVARASTRTDRLRLQVEVALEASELMLGDLPEVVAEWSEMGSGSRASWSHDWDQVVLDHLPFLVQPTRRRRLTPEQRRRCSALVRRLAELRPLLERVGLSVPQMPLALEPAPKSCSA